MATIEQRLKALESKAVGNLSPIIFIVNNDGIPPEEQQQIDEAKSQGRKVLLITCGVADEYQQELDDATAGLEASVK